MGKRKRSEELKKETERIHKNTLEFNAKVKKNRDEGKYNTEEII